MNQVDNIPSDVYSTAMIHAANTFSSGLHGYLTSPSTKFMALQTENRRKMDESGVRKWFEDTEEILYSVLATCNFYKQIHQSYRSLVFGSAVVFREKDKDEVLRYYTLPLYECYWEKDSKGRINSMYRELSRTALQLIEEYGDNCSKQVKDAYTGNDGNKKFKIIHVARPRWQRNSLKKDAKNKKFQSIYFEFESGKELKESGYDRFPYFVGQWIEDSISQYAFGPGHFALYSGRTLNQAALTTIRAFQKKTDPPMMAPHDGFVLPILTDPNTFNYKISSDPNDKIEPMPTGSDPFAGLEFMKWQIDEINQAFFVNLFQAITDTTKRMTIPEVQERKAENAPLLGPSIGGILQEFISPLIYDAFEICAEEGLLPEPPAALLEDSRYSIEYVSPLAKMQRISEIAAIQNFVNLAAPAVQLNPESADNIDTDTYIRVVNDISGAPSSLLAETKDVLMKRQQRQEAQARAEMRQQALEGAEGARNAADADLKSQKARSK